MARDGTVTVKITGDAKGLNSALGESDGHLSRFGDKMGTVAKGVGLAFAAMAAAAVPFAIKAVQLASDVEESFSKVNTIFGKSAGVIDKWAKGAATNIGLSRGAALDAAGTFGNMFTQLGIGVDQAAKMSTGIVNLAADFASFHNADISEVISSQSAAFRGEYDALQKFLPLINAANVEQKAMEMTGKASAKALTAQEKALAVNALMLSGAGKAAGDFSRTSGGLANQLRILKARGEDFLANVGSALLPLVIKGIDLFGKLGGVLKDALAPVFTEIAGGVKAFIAAWKAANGDVTSSGFAGFMEKLANVIRLQLIPAFEKIVEAAKPVVSFIRDNMTAVVAGLTVGAIAFTVAFAAAAAAIAPVAVTTGVALAPILALAAGIGVLVAAVIYAYKNFEGFRDVVDKVAAVVSATVGAFVGYMIGQFGNLVNWVKQFWPQISEAISHVMNFIRETVQFILGIVAALWRAWGDDLLRYVMTVWNFIRETIENAIQLIKGIIQTVVAVINGDWGRAWTGIKNIVGAVWDQIGNIISTAIGAIKGMLGGLASTVGQMALGLWNPIKDGFRSVLNWIIDRWNGLEFKMPSVGPIGGFTVGVPNIPRLHSGGVVPGTPGSDVLAMLQAGERVIPRGGVGTGATVVNSYSIQVTAIDPAAASEAVITAIKEYERRNGTDWRVA